MFEFRILGALEVLRDGERLQFRGRRELDLLAVLLINANRMVSADRLVDELWAGAPPEGARRALRVYVSRLRQALADDDVIVTRPPSYLLKVGTGALDAERFEALAARGRQQAATGDHHGAASSLREALALWRGPALADVADGPLARAEAARLEEARLAVLEDRLDADLACGRHGELTGELDTLTRAHSFRERLWAQRMVALSRSGRQTDALRAYQELREILGEQLGIEPAEALRHLEAAVLRHDADLEWRPDERPAPVTPPRKGVEDRAPPGVVTFLFTDLVGSTELLDRLGEDAADEVRRIHFGVLRAHVAAHGGSEIKSLGDGLMVAFPSPLAALACAVDIQEAAANTVPESSKALAIRIGIHAGEPIRDEDDFFGTPVVLAKRLCDQAKGGQILASALVCDLVGSRGDRFSFRHQGALRLKGLAAPVAACEVTAADVDVTGGPTPEPVALPHPLRRKERRLPLVGRAGELARLEAAWEAARSAQRQLVLVAGEPGIGKSRLTAEFARHIHGDGALVLFGRCDEGMGVPYQPFVEALGRYLEEATAPTLGRLAGELVRLVPEVGERVHGLPPPVRSDPETERYRLFDAVAAWLAAASQTAPLLFVVEDVHWATRPTLLLLSHLVRSDESVSLLLVTTFRDTALDMSGDLADMVAELLRQPGVGRLNLPGLDEPGVAALMEAQAGHELDDDGRVLARVLHEETAGNPFFVEEMLRHLAEKGTIVQRGERWMAGGPVAEVDVPESVREVVGRRLNRLPDPTGGLLALAAVFGERFELATLVAASGEPEMAVFRTLEPALAARLVEETAAGSYHFTHALVRAALEDALGPTRRAQLHRAAGLAIETVHAGDLDAHFPQLARHFAGAGDEQRAVEYATRAGDRALVQLAHDEAVTYYRQALELLSGAEGPPDDRRRMELLISLGEAQRRAGDLASRQTLLEAGRLAQEQGDALAMAQAALANSRGTFSTAAIVDVERVKALEAALEALGNRDPARRARLLAVLAVELLWSPDTKRRHALSDEALALARSLGSPAVLGPVISARWTTLWHPRWAPDRLELAAELLSIAEATGDPYLRFWGLWRGCLASMELADAVEARRSARLAWEQADDLGQPFLHACVQLSEGAVAAAWGRLSEAEERVREFLALGQESLVPDAEAFYTGQLAGIRYLQGRLGEMEPVLRETVQRLPAVGLFRAQLALAYCELGRLTDARATFAPLAGGDFGFDYFAAPTAALLATVCADLDDAREASVLSEAIAPYANQVASNPTLWLGSFSHHLGVLATRLKRYSDAEPYFRAGAATHEGMETPVWLAQTRLEWARMLLRRRLSGDAEKARELLDQAMATARELGLPKIERDAVALLQ